MKSVWSLSFATAVLVGTVGAGSPVARVERYRGEPAVMIDGRPSPPMSMLVMEDWHPKPPAEQRDYYRRLADAGIRVFYVCCATSWRNPGDKSKGWEDGAHGAVSRIRALLDAVPNAKVMLRLNVSPPKDWVEAHPEEMVTYNDGSHRKTVCDTISGEPLSGMLSLCSEKWRCEGCKAIADFFSVLDASEVGGRVIGTFLCAGGTSEWYYPIGMVTPEGLYGDFSESFRKEYERFLRAKYGTVENLRAAWGRPEATFGRPLIPSSCDQAHVFDADRRIRDNLHNWESGDRTVAGPRKGRRQDSSVGVFLNMDGYAHTKDFYDAWHEGTANTIICFARQLKAIHPERLVGAFYGSCGCTGYYALGTATGTLRILDSGAVDFLAAPGVYNNREPGGIVAQREMQDSFRLRNRVYICEDDSRTHLCKPWMQRDAMALYSAKDSVETLKRDFARNICEGLNGWWFDMGNGWYDDPDILELFRRQQGIAKEAFELDRTKKNEIALVADADSMHLVSDDTSKLVLDYWRTSDLGRIGAPADYYFHEDMANPKMPDYKLYVMLNQYALTEAERDAIYAKARRTGATLLWLYAPGFVDETARKRMDVAHVSRTVGMNVAVEFKTTFPHFRVDPSSHPAVAGASATRRYGVIDGDVHSNIWMDRSLIQPAYVNPSFYIDDPKATVLGRFCSDGKVALAMTEADGVRSIYAATPVMQADLLRSLARFAGCHIYLESGDVLYASENFVAVHASSDGLKRVFLKKRCSPVEAYENRRYGDGVGVIETEMKLGETKMWRVDK